MKTEHFRKISGFVHEIPTGYRPGMRAPVRVYGGMRLIEEMDNAVLEQIVNTSMLPGIVNYAMCMPDGHSGYGFPIGGAAAIDPDEGVISPGGIGFDINCGVRLMKTALAVEEVRPRLSQLVDALFARVPSGVGSDGIVSFSPSKFERAMTGGAAWAVENGFGSKEDLEFIEENGRVKDAGPEAVSKRAVERGKNQLGSLGSGNHYLEIQAVRKENIFDGKTAEAFGIEEGRVMVMVHSGSRGFGHQVASDYLQRFLQVMGPVYGLSMPDRELACAPFRSKDGQAYYRAMNCAINIAFLNRQLLTHRVREVFSDFFKKSPEDLGMGLVYDVCHNTAKLEKHEVDGMVKELLVHRKGATRAFGPGMKGLPDRYMAAGQPVLMGGSMETGSYVCAGTAEGKGSFYTTAHGSGRVMSRSQAKKRFSGRDLQKSLAGRGIYIQTASFPGLAEEAGGAYKDIDAVIEAAAGAGLSKPVAKLVPLGNIKG